MRKYALVNNNVVTDVISISEEELNFYTKNNNIVIDITDMVPEPKFGYVLNGNILELPAGNSSREEFEFELALRKMSFGENLAKISIAKIGARNKILNKNGTQVATILNSLLPIKLLLETGALGTARDSCQQLRIVYAEYDDIFNFVINEITVFENTFGL